MKSTMKGARVDLRASLPRGAGWGLRPVATRVFAWHFLNTSKLSWAEFTRPHPQNPKSYFWQVDHTNKQPTQTLAEHLKVVCHTTNEKENIVRTFAVGELLAGCATSGRYLDLPLGATVLITRPKDI